MEDRFFSCAAAYNPDKDVITFIWDDFKKGLPVYFLTECDEAGLTAFHLAASFNTKEVLETIWNILVDIYQNDNEALVKELTRKDNLGENVIFKALNYNSLKEVIEFLWSLSIKWIPNETLRKDFLSARNDSGKPAIAVAYNSAKSNHPLALSRYCEILKDNLSPDERNQTLINKQRKIFTMPVISVIAGFAVLACTCLL